MGTYDLIDEYLGELGRTLEHAPHGGDALAEAKDHLYCGVEQRLAGGSTEEEAQRDALAAMGPSETIARELARGPQDLPALPTPSTVSGSVVALIAAALWLLHPVAMFGMIHLYDRVEGQSAEDSSTPLGIVVLAPWAVSLLGGVALTLATALVLKDRLGGLSRIGWAAVVALGAALAASFIAWFIPGWSIALAIGAALLSVELLRTGLAARAAAVALGVGPALGLATWAVLWFIELGSPDEWGSYPAAVATGVAVGCATVAYGLAGIGLWLRGEQAVQPLEVRDGLVSL